MKEAIYSRRYLLIFFWVAFLAGGFFVGFLFANSASNTTSTLLYLPYGKNFVDQSVLSSSNVDLKNDVKVAGVILNHHLLAPQLVVQALQVVAAQKPRVVVLASPNHFGAGTKSILSTIAEWDTPYGRLKTDSKIIDGLKNKWLLSVENEPFIKEHGIFNIVGFIKKIMPSTKIVPLILKDDTSDADVEKLALALASMRTPPLLISSLDFSHYLPPNVSRFHDQKAVATIKNFDLDGVDSVEIDSKPTLRLALRYAQLRGSKSFSFIKNTNSSEVRGDALEEESTSYIVGYFSNKEEKSDEKVTMFITPEVDVDISEGEEKRRRFLDGFDLLVSMPPQTKVVEIRGKKIALVSPLDFPNLEKIKSSGDFVVALSDKSLDQDYARKLIDSGADMVVQSNGSLGEATKQSGIQIVESSERTARARGEQKKSGLAGFFCERAILKEKPIVTLQDFTVGVVVDSGKFTIHILPVKNQDGLLMGLGGVAHGNVLASISEKSLASASQKEDIINGIITFKF